MKTFYTNILGAICFCTTFLSWSAAAAELRFITLEVAPWAYVEKGTDKFLGIFPDLVKEIESRTGHDIKIALTPYARINRELEAARQDCTMLISDETRQEITVQGELIFNHPMGVVGRKTLDLSSYEDLYGIRISLLRGSVISSRFDEDEYLKKDFDTDYQISLQKIKHGRLDAIAGAIPTIQYLANLGGLGEMLGEPLQLGSEPIYLQCSKSSENVKYLEEINKAIRSIKDDSTLDKIISANT